MSNEQSSGNQVQLEEHFFFQFYKKKKQEQEASQIMKISPTIVIINTINQTSHLK